MEKHKGHLEEHDSNKDEHNHSEKHHLDSLFPHIENSDIKVQVGSVRIIVFKNCTSIYIEGKSTKISFDIPATEHTSAHTHSKVEMSKDQEAEHETHDHAHEENKLKKNEPSEGRNRMHQDKHDRGAEHAPQDKHDQKHDEHEHNHDDEIDLSCEGVQILLCDCCTLLKIKSTDTDLNFPLDNFKKANLILTEEGNYYKRSYNIELLKNKTNERDQKLFINKYEIEVEYNPANRSFNSHLFFENYTNLIDLLADYLKTNPDLNEIKHNH